MSPHIFFTLSLDLMLRELKRATGAYVLDILFLPVTSPLCQYCLDPDEMAPVISFTKVSVIPLLLSGCFSVAFVTVDGVLTCVCIVVSRLNGDCRRLSFLS